MKLQPVRGTRDLKDIELGYHNKIVEVARQLASAYNYDELLPPIFEFSEVFHRTMGETSDVVSKETYTFLDRDKSSITLRPEFTAGVVRGFISNGLTQSIPIKFFSHGPLFRHERPQKYRYRQLYQINFEYLGAATEYSDVETIALAYDILNMLGISDNITLELNTLGDEQSRKIYRDQLVQFLLKYENELSEDSKHRLHRNPLRVLDSKDEKDAKIVLDAPKISDSLTSESKLYYEKIKDQLNNLGIKYVENPKLVRGLDYYTHTVFEFSTQSLGAQTSVLGGGRYDKLVEIMGGPPTKAIGFAAGIDRLAGLMMEKNIILATAKKISLIPIGEAAKVFSIKLAHQLRQKGNLCVDNEIYDDVSKLMKRANKINVSYAVIFGDEELNDQVVKVKNMGTGEEKTCTLTQLLVESFDF